MTKNIGKKLIEEIEEDRKSKIIVYFTGDRKPFLSRIAEDAVRPLYDHLLNLNSKEKTNRIDLFIYSRGGDVSVPWRIVCMLREFCKEFNVLIPYRAQSAATLLSLGSDNIIMGRKAELGPIDPTLVRATIGEAALSTREIAVEDVNSFLTFIKDRANINDQDALATILNELINKIGPLTLGNVNRQHHHIRLAARKLLTSRNEKIDEEKINIIIETLTEKMYSHGHGIGRKEAKEIGLPVKYANTDLENKMWNLFKIYEDYLKLNDPIHPEIILDKKENAEIKKSPMAILESVKKLHVYEGNIKLEKKRKIPANPQINLNINFGLPPNITPQQIPQETQKLINDLSKQIPKMVQEEIMRQSPVIGIEARIYGGKWNEER